MPAANAPLEIKQYETYHRADGTTVYIEIAEKLSNSNVTIFREKAGGEGWTKGGNNFPGGTIPSKCLTGWVHPAIAARLKQLPSPVAGTAKTDRELLDAIRELVKG